MKWSELTAMQWCNVILLIEDAAVGESFLVGAGNIVTGYTEHFLDLKMSAQ